MAAQSKAVATQGNKRTFVFDPSKIDYKAVIDNVERHSKAIGSSGTKGFVARFPGEQYAYSGGEYTKGFKADKKDVKLDSEFVVNAAAGVTCWRRMMQDKKTGKWDVTYTDLVFLADPSADMPMREDLGDTDEAEWATDKKGVPQDPWKALVVFPIRTVKGETVDHLLFSSKSATNAGYTLFREIMESMPMHMGELPVVKLGSRKAKMTNGDKFDVPELTVVSWTDAKPCDTPSASGISSEEVTDDIGEVESVERTPTKKASAPAKAPVKASAQKPIAQLPPPSKKPQAKAAPQVKGKKRQAALDDDEM